MRKEENMAEYKIYHQNPLFKEIEASDINSELVGQVLAIKVKEAFNSKKLQNLIDGCDTKILIK
jgi:hypothetical protein